ncbi:MAG TPA: hypothetical protein VG096_12715 [Bryobacteraceae bacterium]|jgi:hypothetical protein|nr:hypothetical protein [Bryobacteraceae bacterium]
MKATVCLIAALAFTAAAADKPNFSGEWKLNASKSELGPVPAPTSFTRKIMHAEPSLIITDDQKGGTGDQNSTRNYTTDGKEITYQMNGADVKAAATWDGDGLIIRSNADAGGITISFVEKMALTGGNKTLTDAIHIGTPQGDLDITYIFDRVTAP